MNNKNLKNSEIYICDTKICGTYIMKSIGSMINCCPNIDISSEKYHTDGTFGNSNTFQDNFTFEKASKEDKHWLEECIRLNKFITKEEALITLQISKFINNTTVVNKEGEVFKVGDVIKFANNTLKAKIIDFRWKNDKSEICAVLPNIPNGVGIDKIELYVEPKKEETLLEKAIRLYPIGTKFKRFFAVLANDKIESTIMSIPKMDKYGSNTISVKCESGYRFIYNDGKWAEIIEKADDFVLPEKWCVKCNNQKVVDYSNTYGAFKPYRISQLYHHYPSFDNCTSSTVIEKDYTEITFDQFKKYILNEKV